MVRERNGKTLAELLEAGAARKAALVAPDGKVVTYEALWRQVEALAKQLQALGLRRGDRVAIVLPNGIEAVVAFLAVSTAATAAPLNPAYKADEFRFYLEDTGARALITGTDAGEEARKAAPEGTLLIEARLDARGMVGFEAGGRRRGGALASGGAEDVALVLHTSGTTSRPKRVPLTHANLMASMRNIVETYRLTADDVSVCVMPLFHVHGLLASALSPLLSGGTVVVPPRFNAMGFWRTVEEHHVTWYSAVPAMHAALLGRARGQREAKRPRLRFIRSCSSALPPATMQAMEERFGAPVLEAYGMTEASHQIASNPLPPGKRVPGSVGKGTGVEVAVMGPQARLAPPGTRGEVVIKGPNVIKGYENNPGADAASFTDGWFRTGDEGVMDAEGYVTLVGRIKELINRSGEKVSPREIDEVLLAHPAVVEAVAFGAPHKRYGEAPYAAVVLRGAATASELVAHCRAHLADFKCPETIYIVQAIPRTATGKVQRRLVAEMVGERAKDQ